MKLSVICTNYNKGKWIGQALDGILNQELEMDFEILVIDDASTDGSDKIIKSYAQKYPEVIKAFFNEENKGITKTWKVICQEAKGEYIARCDADDYWFDHQKIKKQFDLLAAHPESEWSISDFDIITAEGEVTQEKAIASGSIRKMSTFEEELAYKGMTMSSTWLVKRDILLEANANLADDAVDDTFNLQLELFQRTQVSFLEDSTTYYRLGYGSDSHPDELAKAAERFERLKATQLEYLEKNKAIDFYTLSIYLFDEVCQHEIKSYGLELEKKMTNDYLAIIEREKAEAEGNVIRLEDEQKNLKEECRNLEERITLHISEINERNRVIQELIDERDEVIRQYHGVINSKRWRIPTKVINFFRRK